MLAPLLQLPGAMWAVMLELAPWLLLGAVVAGLLHGLVPPDLVQKKLRGLPGVVRAVVLGVPLPLCSCGVIPAGVGLKKSGASNGASIGFLIATPQTGVDSAAVAAGFLGWPFALYKVAAALVTGLVGGALVELVDPGTEEHEDPAAAHADRSVRGMITHAIDVVRMIWGWLLFGVVVSAVLTVLLPAGALTGVVGGGAVVAMLLVLAASVPLYVCATASVPIAAALVTAGLPTGAALVFLMAGPATNVATLGAVWRTFGGKALAGYLGTILVGSIGLGLAYEPLLGDLVALQTGHHAHTAWWAQVAAVALAGSFLWFAVEELRGRLQARRAARLAREKRPIAIDGMTCGGCASRLQRVLNAREGVDAATVSFDDGLAVVQGVISMDDIRRAVEDAGFAVKDGAA
jgi:uncharacterized membrane protein YraQ (UPF0718 family)/copper chaperone CopZ